MKLFSELRLKYRYADPVMRLIAVNAAFFGLALLVNLFGFLFFKARLVTAPLLSLSSSPAELLYKPWTILTYQFTHFGLLHFGFNMLVLYFSGHIFLDFYKRKDAWKVYIFGGLAAGGVFMLSTAFIPAFSGARYTLIGASGSVMAILFAATLYAPNITLQLFGVFPVRLKWIALAYIVLDLLSIPESNAGGHIAHLGGAAFGSLFALYRMKKVRLTLFEPVTVPLKKQTKMKAEVRQTSHGPASAVSGNARKGSPTQEEVDAILDKISKSGYDRLSKEEKDILFKASQD